MKTAITTENWSKILSVCLKNNNDLLLELCQFISENFSDIRQSENFKTITFQELTFITKNVNRSIVEEVSIYEAVQSWIGHDKVNRADKFLDLFFTLCYLELPDAVLTEIASDPCNQAINQLVIQTAPLRKAMLRAKIENKIFTQLKFNLFVDDLSKTPSSNFDYDEVTPSANLIYDANSFATSIDEADVVGFGRYGVVRRCVYPLLGKVVIKCMHCGGNAELDSVLDQTHKRVHVFSRFDHEFIVRFHEMTSWVAVLA